MTLTRIYQALPLALHTSQSLNDNASHYLTHVLRARVGDNITLFNGQGGEYTAVITHMDKKGVDVDIIAFAAREVESPLVIHLAQGIARGEKMDFIVQKAVELGVHSIIPLFTERCNVKLDGEREKKRIQHWQSVAISACEQSGRNRVPLIAAPNTLVSWLPKAQAQHGFVLSPHVSNKLSNYAVPQPAELTLLIGPEGGLSESEISLAVSHGFLSLNLGPRVLRTETATIAALSALQAYYGDF